MLLESRNLGFKVDILQRIVPSLVGNGKSLDLEAFESWLAVALCPFVGHLLHVDKAEY